MLDSRECTFETASFPDRHHQMSLVLLQADEALEVLDRHFLKKNQAELQKKKHGAVSSMNWVLNWKTLN